MLVRNVEARINHGTHCRRAKGSEQHINKRMLCSGKVVIYFWESVIGVYPSRVLEYDNRFYRKPVQR